MLELNNVLLNTFKKEITNLGKSYLNIAIENGEKYN